MYNLHLGDSKKILKTIPSNSIDSIVTDPPYEIGFMGKRWDSTGIAYDMELWRECLRVLKPGGYCAAFGATKSYHRMAVAVEDAGFEIRDTLFWLYGSGFPKGKNIDTACQQRGIATPEAFKGYWSTLKPCTEPIVLAQKPFKRSILDNLLLYGVGAMNIDECRIGDEVRFNPPTHKGKTVAMGDYSHCNGQGSTVKGRYPGNVIMSDEVLQTLAKTQQPYFYCPKATKTEREFGLDTLADGTRQCYNGAKDGAIGGKKISKNIHPTVKPLELMQWLCRLITPKNGIILDPFCGSGSTGIAAVTQGYSFEGVDMSAEYLAIADARITAWQNKAI